MLEMQQTLTWGDDGSVNIQFYITEQAMRKHIKELESQLEDELLDRIEPMLNSHGWFKRKSCEGCYHGNAESNICTYCCRDPRLPDFWAAKIGD